MKLRHAAALALVGWYLMVPPIGEHGVPDSYAPFARWTILESFDRADHCRMRLGYMLTTDELNEQTSLELNAKAITRTALRAAVRIASDDPRLKPK